MNPGPYAAMLVAWLACAGAHAQAYPAKPLRLIVPTSVGTPLDISGRLAATHLQASLGQPIVIDNRPGAAETVGLAELARQGADGYTLLVLGMPGAVAPSLYPQARIDFTRDYQAVGLMSLSSGVLVVHPDLPVRSVAELVALLKREPGRYSFGSGGNGTPAHLGGELFKQLAGVSAQHVPYTMMAQAVTDLLSGRVQFMFLTAVQALAQVEAGKLRALAVTGEKRLAALGEVPTMVEAGFPAFVVRGWEGLLVKAGTPRAVVERLNAELNRVMQLPEVRAQLAKSGSEPAGGTPEQFSQWIEAEVQRWRAVARAAKLRAD